MKFRVPSRLLPILLVNFIGALGFSLVLPFLVYLVLDLGGNALIYGFIGATYSAFQFVGAPLLGRWSDDIGRRPVLLISQAGTLLAWVLFLVALLIPMTEMVQINQGWLGAFTLTVPLLLLFLARALDGITGGNISVAQAYVADLSDDGSRKRNFGLMAASASLGFVLGPALAGVLGSTAWGNIPPILGAIVISLVGLLLIIFLLPKNEQQNEEAEISQAGLHKTYGQEHRDCLPENETTRHRTSLADVLKLPHVPLLLGLYFAVFLAFNFFYVGFPLQAAQVLGWDALQLGLFFTLLSGLTIFVQGPLLSWLSNLVDEIPLIVFGSVMLAINFGLVATDNPTLTYLAAAFFALGNGLMWPSFLSVLADAAGKKYQGAVQGFGGSAGSLASIIGLVAGGFVYRQIGATTFLISAGVILLCGIVSLQLRKVDEAKQEV